jgi:hypothetical protein
MCLMPVQFGKTVYVPVSPVSNPVVGSVNPG